MKLVYVVTVPDDYVYPVVRRIDTDALQAIEASLPDRAKVVMTAWVQDGASFLITPETKK